MTHYAQGSLFGEGGMAPPVRTTAPDPQEVRGRLRRLLETLREANTMPFSDKDMRMWQIVVPNMVRWLPDHEATAIQSEFTLELERLLGVSA